MRNYTPSNQLRSMLYAADAADHKLDAITGARPFALASALADLAMDCARVRGSSKGARS